MHKGKVDCTTKHNAGGKRYKLFFFVSVAAAQLFVPKKKNSATKERSDQLIKDNQTERVKKSKHETIIFSRECK